MMEHYYDQRFGCCEACHHFRDSIIEGRKACGAYGMAFTEEKGIVDGACGMFKTEAQWQEEQRRAELIRKQSRRRKG